MENVKNSESITSSFRDPSGFLFYRNGSIYRQINRPYREDYEHLMNSGLYEKLVKAGLLVVHEEVDIERPNPDKAYKIIKPFPVPFISYPYEWSFSQLKAAALATLRIEKKALDSGMSLKDCSAYNIQLVKNKPMLIDTLSFEKYREGEPWVAYRQFCQHFLAPLALTTYRDIRLAQLLKTYIDGVPLDLAGKLLPLRTYFNFALFVNIHLHAKSQEHFADKSVRKTGLRLSRTSLLGLIDNLESAIRRLRWTPPKSEWAGYYDDIGYSPDSFNHKKALVGEFLEVIKPDTVWDLGSNTGVFSRIAGEKGATTIAFDADPAAVEKNYLECISKREGNPFPLWLDLVNPSPALGWDNEERFSFSERGPCDTALALALIHHLAISNNLPFGKIALFFNRICRSLIVEFAPKSDSKVQKLLASREDIFKDYTQQIFEDEFKKFFSIIRTVCIRGTGRTLYLMKRHES